jgi:hypothetical protein
MSLYNDIVTWIDNIMTRNGRNSITGTHANKMGKDLADYTKSIEDLIGSVNGLAQLDENGLLISSQRPAQDVTRERSSAAISGGNLVLDYNAKNELIVTKAGGGGIDVSGNFAFGFLNSTNAEFCQGFLNVSAIATITLPAGTITGNFLELGPGEYQFVFSFDGLKWHFTISEIES